MFCFRVRIQVIRYAIPTSSASDTASLTSTPNDHFSSCRQLKPAGRTGADCVD